MKKKLNILFGLIISFLMIIIPTTVLSYEEDPTITVEASQSNGTVNIHGETFDDVEVPTFAVAVAVYKENELIAMQTVSTKKLSYIGDMDRRKREYSTSINLPEGTYLIKAACYEGGPFAETTIAVSKSNEEETSEEIEEQQGETTTSENPITSDNIMKVAAIFAISVLGILVVIMINKKIRNEKTVK